MLLFSFSASFDALSIIARKMANLIDAIGRLCVANRVPQKDTWRITLTPHVINDSAHVVITTGGTGIILGALAWLVTIGAPFVMIIVLLLIRPQGLFSRQEWRRA